MKTPVSRRCLIGGVSAVALTSALGAITPASAQDRFPNRPIRLVVPFPPGGGTDALARQIAERITTARGWVFVIDNKPGVGGNIGLDAVAKARPDGYTIGMGQTANLAINPSLYDKMPFDASKDFSPIALVAAQPLLIVVRTESPLRSLADLVAEAKRRPGGVTMASAGAGTSGHLSGEMFAKRAGVAFTHVPYKGFGPALNDLFGGQTDFLVTSPQSGIAQIRGGKLRALAVTAGQRLAVLPQVPTAVEQGYAGFEPTDWKGIVGPAGMPPAIVAELNASVQDALRHPETIAKFAEDGGTAMLGSAARMRDFIRSEQVLWGAAVRDSGARAD